MFGSTSSFRGQMNCGLMTLHHQCGGLAKSGFAHWQKLESMEQKFTAASWLMMPGASWFVSRALGLAK
jgi:hypothetical protein